MEQYLVIDLEFCRTDKHSAKLAKYYVPHEVIQIGEVLGLPEYLIKKTPSDGLSGMSDEDKIGFSYATLDHYVLTGECEDEEIRNKIDRMHRINLHKLRLMPAFQPEE